MIGYTIQYDSDITNINYLKGTYIFVNLLNKKNNIIESEKAQKTIDELHKLGLKVIVDVNDETLIKHNINEKTLNKIWKIDYLRIDKTNNYNKIVPFLKYVGLAFNASTIRKSDLEKIKDEMKILQLNDFQKQNILWIHNHYPKIGTGLSTTYFLNQNKLFESFGGKICSFISGDQAIGPEYNFLSTIEEERYFNVYLAYLKHTLLYKMDIVFIGDNIISNFDQEAINYYISKNVITIPVIKWLSNHKDFLNSVVNIRKDFGNNILRIDESRIYYSKHKEIEIIPENNNKIEGMSGMIFLDNKNSDNYIGDLSLIIKKIQMNEMSNFVGEIPIQYREILDLLFFDHQIIFKLI